MSGRLEGRIAVITGGGRGLGYAMAQAVAAEGADVALLDLLDDLDQHAERLAEESGRRVIGVRGDVTDADGLAEVFTATTDQLDVPTVLINAAGVALTTPALETTPDQWRRVIDINLTGTFLTNQVFAQRAIAAGRPGVIVNVASMSGVVVNVPQQQAAYNASKAAVSMLTASLAIEWLPHDIRVNAIGPGYFASEMTKGVTSSDPDMMAEWMRRTPAGRMGEPPELGPLAVYLCSDESRFVVGQTMIIDGGYTLSDRVLEQRGGERVRVRSVAELVERAETLRGSGRTLLGLVGAPGAGKTTIAERLAAGLGASAAHVPMDGYHLADAALRAHGTLLLKGAPQTFDGWGYLSFVKRIRSETDHLLYAPAFERDLEQPLANSIMVSPEQDYVVSEGNYLLLPQEPWPQVRACFDQIWYVGMDESVRLERLIARHVEFGKDPELARTWVMDKDERNAALIAATERYADVRLDVTDLTLD